MPMEGCSTFFFFFPLPNRSFSATARSDAQRLGQFFLPLPFKGISQSRAESDDYWLHGRFSRLI